jgi:hypothetical protein
MRKVLPVIAGALLTAQWVAHERARSKKGRRPRKARSPKAKRAAASVQHRRPRPERAKEVFAVEGNETRVSSGLAAAIVAWNPQGARDEVRTAMLLGVPIPVLIVLYFLFH